MDELKVTTEDKDGTTVIRISGEADMLSTDHLERTLDQVIVRRPALVLIDLTGLAFITSLGMGALARFSQAIKRHGRVQLFAPPGHVRDVLFRSRVIELFEEVNAA